MKLKPLLALLQTAVLVNLIISQIGGGLRRGVKSLIANTITTLSIIQVIDSAAAGRHTARLHPIVVAHKINILIPVVGVLDAAALEPVPLDPVDQVLQVFVVAIQLDHALQILLDLFAHLFLVHVDENSDGELGKENDAQREAEQHQQHGVLSQRAHTPAKTDYEHEAAHNEEYERRVEKNADRETAETRKSLFFNPRVNTDPKDCESDKPENDIEAEEKVFYKRAYFSAIATPHGHGAPIV